VPGQLNLMTAGRGIVHSEQSPADHPPVMHGLQLWIALPEHARHGEARFEHHAALPPVPARVGNPAADVTVVVGELAGARSPARVHTPLLAAEVRLPGAGGHRLALDATFEHGVLVLSGAADVAGEALAPGSLLYLGPGRDELAITSTAPARLFVLGGEPFDEPLVMWWNFVGRSHEEIAQARTDWAAGRRFGTVAGCTWDPLPAPPMPTVRLRGRDRHGQTVG
jgi:redox-sensitive bicupin YhaK (pirin superfamily)